GGPVAAPQDAGTPPAAPPDAGLPQDAGTPPATPPDAGLPQDAGTPLPAHDAGMPAPDAGPGAACASGIAALDLAVDTSGGFTGQGGRDHSLAGDTLSVHDPFATPPDCSAKLTAQQRADLYAAAAAVEWSAVQGTYIRPENPNCCCDQIVSVLDVTLRGCDGGMT